MPRPQFTLRALLVLLLAVACFFGGIRFERERRRRADEAAWRAMPKQPPPPVTVWPAPLEPAPLVLPDTDERALERALPGYVRPVDEVPGVDGFPRGGIK